MENQYKKSKKKTKTNFFREKNDVAMALTGWNQLLKLLRRLLYQVNLRSGHGRRGYKAAVFRSD